MGNDLTEENSIKPNETEDNENEYIKYGIVTNKGEEKTFDDSHLSLLNISDINKNSSLFGIFDGHNTDYVSKYLKEKFSELFKKEFSEINDKNYENKIQELFKTIDKNLKVALEEKEKENKNLANIDNDLEKDFNFIKEQIIKSKLSPENQIDDEQLKELIIFKNLFKNNNNFLYNNTNLNYIGSSTAIVLIKDFNIYIANLGITKYIIFNKNYDKNDTKSIYISEEHTFKDKKEKKRIKKFNKSIEYDNLKINMYLPASRSFGFYKYKSDDILKEENQIISCVPDVEIFNRKDYDFILLMTKGMYNLIGNKYEKLINNIIKNIGKMKLSNIIEDFINSIKNEEKNSINNTSSSNNSNSQNKIAQPKKLNTIIYVGKEDCSEENDIINELNNNYNKDVMNLNKNNDCNGNYNITCILIQLLDAKIEKIEIVDNLAEKIEDKKEEKKEEEKEDNEEKLKSEIKEETKNDNKENTKPEKKEENKEGDIDKKEEDNGEKIEKDKENMKEEKKEEEKEKKEDNIEEKTEENKVKIEGDNENNKEENKGENKEKTEENKVKIEGVNENNKEENKEKTEENKEKKQGANEDNKEEKEKKEDNKDNKKDNEENTAKNEDNI